MMGMLVQRPKMEEDCSYCKRRGESRVLFFSQDKVTFHFQTNCSLDPDPFNASEVQYLKKKKKKITFMM